MNITGKIKGIQYKVLFSEDLQEIALNIFEINKAPSSCLINENKHTFAISKWVSPKRTRSYQLLLRESKENNFTIRLSNAK